MMNNTGIITQARMTSTRLPGKVLKTIEGKTILEYQLDRLSFTGLQIIVATTTLASDNPIASFCEKAQIPCFRGSEEDVLSRYYVCAKAHGLHTIVRVTSDCPLIDGNLLKEGLQNYKNSNAINGYLSAGLSKTFSRGFDFEIFSFDMLEKAFFEAKLPYEREHVTPYFYHPPKPIFEIIPFSNKHDSRNHRITVDTVEDFQLIETLITQYQAQSKTYHEIDNILDEHPELVALNAHIEQKKL